MEKATSRRVQFQALFARYGKEPDWKFLSDTYADMADYEWKGLIHSIHLILARRAEREIKN